MAAGTNNTNDDKKKKERAKQEATSLQDFVLTTQRRIEQMRGSIDFSTSTSNSNSNSNSNSHNNKDINNNLNLSDGEKKILQDIHNSGMVEGIIAGVAAFVFLRKFPRQLEKMAARRSSSNSSSAGYKLDVPAPGKVNSPFSSTTTTTTNSSSSSTQGMSAGTGANANAANAANAANGSADLGTMNRRQGSFISRALGFTVDLTLSFIVAAYTSYYMADREKIAKSLVEIPLMEGRSAISDNFCSDLIKEYHRQLQMNPNITASSQTNDTTSSSSSSSSSINVDMSKPLQTVTPFDRKQMLQNPQELQNPILKAYLEFIHNCQKRQKMEQRIRQEQGLTVKDPVYIPSPGVITSESEDFFDESFNNDDDDDDATDFMDDFSKDDADSFVTDQDDDSNSNSKK